MPLPSHSLRLEAIPELKYDPLSEPPRGEVCLKGDIIFKGYYKAEDLTKEVLDADGWFHTGDVGEVLPSGALKIIDRKKQVSTQMLSPRGRQHGDESSCCEAHKMMFATACRANSFSWCTRVLQKTGNRLFYASRSMQAARACSHLLLQITVHMLVK